MERSPVFYTLKVWLGSVTVSPLVAGILQFYGDDGRLDHLDWLPMYPVVVIFEMVLTFLVWVLFWCITAIISDRLREERDMRLAASITGIAIAGAICWMISDDKSWSLKDIFFDVALANCFCIFAGCWYFNISRRVTRPVAIPQNSIPHEN